MVKVDFSKISGPYRLLAVLLVVVEPLLAAWFAIAADSTERIIAGLMMVILLLAVVRAVVLISSRKEGPIVPGDLGKKVDPARTQATKKDIIKPKPQDIPAPDGTYVINRPPQGWTVREMTLGELSAEGLRVTDPGMKQTIKAIVPEIGKILTLQSSRQVSIIPLPGTTIIDGRKVPTALGFNIPIRLSIMVMNRYVPPFFVERPIAHNFVSSLLSLFSEGMGALTLHQISTSAVGNRKILKAECRQVVENATVNDIEGENVISNITLIAIEGELQDYLLMMNYPSFPEKRHPEIENDRQILLSLVDSFRPLGEIAPDKKRIAFKVKADENFETLMSTEGEKLFRAEMMLLNVSFVGWDMDDPKERLEAIRLLKPFEAYANEIDVKDEELESLWEAMHRAEKGDATRFKEIIAERVRESREMLEWKQRSSG